MLKVVEAEAEAEGLKSQYTPLRNRQRTSAGKRTV